MCISTPKVPSVPQRQASKLPDMGSSAASSDLNARRRRGLYASILTNQSGGGLGAPNVSGVTGATLG